MTAEQIYQKWNDKFHLEGNSGGIQKHKHYILEMLNEFGKLMCDKQRELCKDYAQYEGSKYECAIDEQSILNAPYPDELIEKNLES